MKSLLTRILSALLAGLMILPAVSCGKGVGPADDTENSGTTEAVAEEDTGYKPDIEKKDYDREFVMLGVEGMSTWAVADEDTAGDPFMDSIYERGVRVGEYLGVELAMIPGGAGKTYSEEVIRTVQAGDDAYQLVLAACHNGVYTLLSSGAMFDFAKLESIDMNASYWNRGIMEEYMVNDQYLVGYNDFCLANAACLVFNKDMAAKYLLADPYEDVRSMKWTLDRMVSFASVVAEDNGDTVWDINDVYGLTGNGLTDHISLTVACGIHMVARDEEGTIHVAYDDNSEKMIAYLKKLEEIDRGDYSFFGKPQTETNGLEASFDDSHALIRMQGTVELPAMRNTPVRFGVLPYPMYDEAQGRYISLNWNGLLMIPGAVKDPTMVGEVVELLAYYTAPVKTVFYEDLLGSKIAEAPEDAEMLDIIWDTQTSDVCLAASADVSLAEILYLVPFLARDGVDQYASYLKKRVKTANKSLDRLFNPHVRG